MKRKIVFILVIAVVFVLSVGCTSSNTNNTPPATNTPTDTSSSSSSPSTDTGKVIHLTLSDQWGATAYINTDLLTKWKSGLEDATNGQYTIDIYPANTLTPTAENYQDVVNGVSDIGMVPFSVTPGRFPVIEAFMLPGVANFNNATGAGYALNEALQTLQPDEVKDTHMLYTFSTGANVLLSNKSITSLEDMKGLSLGSTQAERANALTLMGANPVSLNMPDWYESLQKGMIVGGITSPEALEGFSLYEVTGDYILDWPYFNVTMFYCAMNIDTYNSLSPEAKAYFDQVPDYMIGAWDYLVPHAIDLTKSNKNVTINKLTDTESQRWLDTLAPMVQANIDSLNSKGFDGTQLHQMFQDLATKYNGLYPNSLLGD